MNFSGSDFINDETKFIVGIDLGNSRAGLAYYDFNLKKPMVFDISGGYSKASIPVVVQYVPESDEWIFGEYAVLNRPIGDEITFKDIIKNMGKEMSYEVGGKTISLCYILSLFIKDVMDSLKNINPKAKVCGIVVSVEAYITEEAKKEIKNAFYMAGFGDSFIGFRDERQCLINYYFENKEFKKDKLLILDYGERSFRGNLFSLEETEDKIIADCDLSLSDNEGGTAVIYNKLEKLFKSYFFEISKKNNLTEDEKKEISIFSYEHSDLFLQRSNNSGIKLYYNFCFPPVKKNVSKDEIDNFIKPFESRLNEFLATFKNEECDVLAVGGGFEQYWAKKAIAEIFGKDKINQTGKEMTACGACLIACYESGVIRNFKEAELYDRQKIREEIGVIANKIGFIPLSERNTFWYQEQKKKYFIIDENDANYILEIFKKNKGEIVKISELNLKELKKTKKKASKICLQVKYESCDNAKIHIWDLGFGEIQKSSGFDKSFEINL